VLTVGVAAVAIVPGRRLVVRNSMSSHRQDTR
jgi:hypothetical protein